MGTPFESRLVFDDYRNRKAKLEYQELEIANFEARLASNLIERWGVVVGMPDGEDSAGRQQGRLMTVEELVDRSVQTAAQAIEAFRKQGWMHKLPTFVDKDVFEASGSEEST